MSTAVRVKCRARKSDGVTPCRAWAVAGRSVCWAHGGASPAPGPSHPNFRHGRYSRVVPRGIRSLYEAGLRDPELLAMTDEMAVLDARAGELLARIGTGESAERWKQVREAMRVVLSFQAQGDGENTEEAISELSKLIFASDDYEGWGEIVRVYDARRKISNTERARRQAAEASISAAQVMALMSSLSAIIVGHVADPQARTLIAEDIRRLMSREGLSSGNEIEAEAL